MVEKFLLLYLTVLAAEHHFVGICHVFPVTEQLGPESSEDLAVWRSRMMHLAWLEVAARYQLKAQLELST